MCRYIYRKPICLIHLNLRSDYRGIYCKSSHKWGGFVKSTDINKYFGRLYVVCKSYLCTLLEIEVYVGLIEDDKDSNENTYVQEFFPI